MIDPTVTAKALRMIPALPVYWKTYRLLKKSQWWTGQQMEEYQMSRLSRVLRLAYDKVPYYTGVFNEHGIRPEDIKEPGDLRKLPFLTKQIIRDNLKDLVVTGINPSRLEYVTTGGSTGVPLGFYYERGVSRAVEWGFIKTLWERVGYNFRDRCVILKGNVVETAGQGKFHKKVLFGRWLVLSSYHMTEDNLPGYLEEIRKFRPKYIQSYPSTVSILAKFMINHGYSLGTGIKAVFCGSENMYPGQRELIEKAMGCRVYTWYGHAERVALAGECEDSNTYHLFPEYGITEIVKEDGTPVENENEVGSIVGTGLTNFVMPLIRYRTDDLAAFIKEPCRCGRGYPLITNVQGRWLQEFIITSKGRQIPITAINMHSDVFDNVDQFQFYQDKKEELVFNIVRKASYSDRDTEYIRSELQKKLGDDISLVIRFVDSIPRTGRGKFNFLVQKLPVELTRED